MPDLRTRIAAVQLAHWVDEHGGCTCGAEFVGNTADDWPLHVADAVIAELNLAKACEGGCVWQIPNRFQDMTDTQKQLLKPRLVADRDCTPLELPADWKADNE